MPAYRPVGFTAALTLVSYRTFTGVPDLRPDFPDATFYTVIVWLQLLFLITGYTYVIWCVTRCGYSCYGYVSRCVER